MPAHINLLIDGIIVLPIPVKVPL